MAVKPKWKECFHSPSVLFDHCSSKPVYMKMKGWMDGLISKLPFFSPLPHKTHHSWDAWQPGNQHPTWRERKWAESLKNDIRVPVLSHTSFRGQVFDGVWKEGMETLGEGGVKVCTWVGGWVRFCTILLVRFWDIAWTTVLIFFLEETWLLFSICPINFFQLHFLELKAMHRTLPSKVKKISLE